VRRSIHADHANGDWGAFLCVEGLHLAFEVVNDAINLFDHCLLNDFDLDADFYCCDGPRFTT
jgi:hypothetical protein